MVSGVAGPFSSPLAGEVRSAREAGAAGWGAGTEYQITRDRLIAR